MIALLHAELLKLRTTRTFAALAALAIATSILIAGLVAILTEPTKEHVLYDVFAADTSSFFILVLAVVGISGEWRHRTITSSLLAAPYRVRFLGAKAIAFATAGLVLSLMIAVAVTIVGATILFVRDLPLPEAGDLVGQVARNALLAALLGAFGVTIGGLVRNQIVAVVTLLILSFAVEPVLIELVPHVGRFGPFGALPTAVADLPPETAGLDAGQIFDWAPAVLLQMAWVGCAFVPAVLLLLRRDVE
jgi:ABC-2 type transport system permease protein